MEAKCPLASEREREKKMMKEERGRRPEAGKEVNRRGQMTIKKNRPRKEGKSDMVKKDGMR